MRASDVAQVGGGPQLKDCSEGGEYLDDIVQRLLGRFPQSAFRWRHGISCPRRQLTPPAEAWKCTWTASAGRWSQSLTVPNTGGWQNWVNISAPITPVNGEHAVYLRFVGGAGKLFNLQSFHLTPAKPFAGQANAATKVTYALGCSVLGEKDPAQFAEAVKAAREADVALVFVGADEQVASEGQDRSYIHLPGAQHELVQAVYAANPRTILVISSNCPVAVNWEQDNLPAIVGGLFLGEQQGYALAEVLFGDYNPGGKLSTTWYRRR